MSIVRQNLMERPGYTPYCGAQGCPLRMPRTYFNGKQFACGCGWQSSFEAEFIEQYKQRNAPTRPERTSDQGGMGKFTVHEWPQNNEGF